MFEVHPEGSSAPAAGPRRGGIDWGAPSESRDGHNRDVQVAMMKLPEYSSLERITY